MKQGIDPAIAAKAAADWDRFVTGQVAKGLRGQGREWADICRTLGERRATLERWIRLGMPDRMPDGRDYLAPRRGDASREPVQ